jgi:hypothetical protein
MVDLRVLSLRCNFHSAFIYLFLTGREQVYGFNIRTCMRRELRKEVGVSSGQPPQKNMFEDFSYVC